MADPRTTRSNAADSAPGVGDGPRGGGSSAVNAKPGGRKVVWAIVGVVLLIIVVSLFARPKPSEDNASTMVGAGTTASEVQEGSMPGASQPGANQRSNAPAP